MDREGGITSPTDTDVWGSWGERNAGWSHIPCFASRFDRLTISLRPWFGMELTRIQDVITAAGLGKKSVDGGLGGAVAGGGSGSSLRCGGTRSVRTVLMADTLAAADRMTR